jgi:lipoate-protein ligase A
MEGVNPDTLTSAVTRSSVIRVLQDGALNGPTNMARDEALLIRVGRSESPPTLRLYQWNPPTISLGYFQRFADYASLAPPAGALPVVRRLTGGGAILHDLELTYSLILPSDHRLLAKGTNRLYELVHDAVIACLGSQGTALSMSAAPAEKRRSPQARGPFFCFERRHRYDVLFGKDKIAGSAQRRRRDAVLQHGSIILANRYPQQRTASVARPFEETIRHLRATLPEHLANMTCGPFETGGWSAVELIAAGELEAKYTDRTWVRRM